MPAVWQVQQAKNHFSELIERAVSEGPQTITRHGRPVVRVVAVDATTDEAQSTGKSPRVDDGFVEFLLTAPRVEGGLPEMPRDISTRPPLFGDE
ncbi:type II toxin-antitoxin system Phd/YefM family antitoxin [Melaminivora suipulveris]|uniref:Antitoxin n=1 Tax=Melaminivora suipulveris TaxID=2109913 RepID=A0A2R3QGP6_9BURK|nr:type II toxin-antitoxin system Phd/YefM family antitoxin [Melaminivora suipulveris]AVO50924.1 type II toxin-antitoxin system Phd/YefM family antitoxin [Melaminivora suipulveris]